MNPSTPPTPKPHRNKIVWTEDEVRLLVAQEVENRLGQVLGSMAGQLGAKPVATHSREWFPTREAYVHLDLPNARRLLRQRPFMREGYHWRPSTRNPNAIRPDFDWHISHCQEFLSGQKKR